MGISNSWAIASAVGAFCRMDKRLDAMIGDEQRHRAFETMAEIGAVGGELISGDILMGKGDLGAE